MFKPDVTLYESPVIREVTGDTIRPGGFTLTDRAVTRCGFLPGGRVLDAGCGTGATVDRLNERFGLWAVGIDSSRLLLTKGTPQGKPYRLAAAIIPELPFKDRTFDGVICECVLSLLSERPTALRRFYDILKPHGHLILTDIYARSDQENLAFPISPIRSCINGALPMDTVLQLVKNAGFNILLFEDHSALLRQLAVKLIFEYGSLSRFWGAWCSKDVADETATAVSRLKPGYYLLIAQKHRNESNRSDDRG